MKKTNGPILRQAANFWSMCGYPSAKKEWSYDRKTRAMKEAGFDCVATGAGAETKGLLDKYGLTMVGYFSSGNPKEFRRLLSENKAAGAHHINVQLADEDTLLPEALRQTLLLMKEAEKLGVEPAVEIHRDTCTETPEKAYALADAYFKKTGQVLRMTLDFSHLAVVKHLHPGNYASYLLRRPDIIRKSQQFHLRPFNGHHCQIPVTDGKGNLTPELKDWLPFVEELFRVWRQGQPAGRELYVCPEMGPYGGYNISTWPHSWDEAVILRGLIEKAWVASAKPAKAKS
jgi:hypothetical protein